MEFRAEPINHAASETEAVGASCGDSAPVADAVALASRRIEACVRRDPGQRGFASHAPAGLLLPAACELFAARRLLVMTGFFIRRAGRGETDGPPGALALVSAMRQLGKPVALVTDQHSGPLLAAGLQALGESCPVHVVSTRQAVADAELRHLLQSFAPSHVLAIERPGCAVDGHCYSMRGEILDEFLPRFDVAFPPANSRAYRTLAVGDGGNELGMGGLRETLKARVMHGDLIFCATSADHVVPAGISNWGGYALAAVVSLLAGRRLIRSADRERDVLQAMVDAGAVDGVSLRGEMSVDGIDWATYANTLEEIDALTSAGLTRLE